MPKYLIDVNLPYHFSLWKSDDYIHQKDINDEWTDAQIWDYAKENNLTIITKESDFSNRIIFHQPPPKVIHIRFGNMRMNDFFLTISAMWNDVIALS
jgi:predicted nuclease of predicted toxin-antitoxin system